MKKLVIALTAAAAAFASPALAADLAARPYTKAPAPIAPVYNWTGFYIFGGGGGGLWAADQNVQTNVGSIPLSIDHRQGGSGWFGTVGLGYDWQFNGPWVFGLFADGQFGSIKGTLDDPFNQVIAPIKLEDSWAVGARVGYLVAPNVLSYVNGGYSGSQWSRTTLLDEFSGAPVGGHTNSFTRNGWFIGGGVENSLNIFGISSPGWFMKTEYRSAFYDKKSVPLLFDGTNLPVGTNLRFNSWNQTISTSLVYRFNWGGAPISAKY
jgi:outer membrane immunogenic protein